LCYFASSSPFRGSIGGFAARQMLCIARSPSSYAGIGAAVAEMGSNTTSDATMNRAAGPRSDDRGPDSPSLAPIVPASASDSAEPAICRMFGFRPLDMREVSAANVLIATQQRRHRRSQLRWGAAVLAAVIGALLVAAAVVFLVP
jgi:hypothetical protein